MVRIFFGFAASWLVTFAVSVAFYTQQVISGYAKLGLAMPIDDVIMTYGHNLVGQMDVSAGPSFGAMLAVALFFAFGMAALVKRMLKPFAGVAYPVAGLAAVGGLFLLIESQFPGVGVFGGVRTHIGFGLQLVAGFLGGVTFAFFNTYNR